MKRIITERMIKSFKKYLLENERAEATARKYIHDVRCFVDYCGGRAASRMLTLDYKSKLTGSYAVRSANSMLAAINSFFRSA